MHEQWLHFVLDKHFVQNAHSKCTLSVLVTKKSLATKSKARSFSFVDSKKEMHILKNCMHFNQNVITI